MRKRVGVIYNPTPGRELFKRVLSDALIKLEKAGYETSAYATERIGDTTFEAEGALESEHDLLIAAGNDGTLDEVVNGVAEQLNQPKPGVIPVGTVNNFGRILHLPNDIMGTIDVIIDSHTTKVNIGKMSNRYFTSLATGEKLTQVSHGTPNKLKSIVGPFAYYVKGFEISPQMKAVDIRIECDDDIFQREALLSLSDLTNSMVSFEKLVPDAKLDNSYLTLIIVEKANPAELGHTMTLASRGEHTKHPKIIYAKARSINVPSSTDMQLNVDGEYGGKLPTNFLNLEQHIEIPVPKDIFSEELLENDTITDITRDKQ